MRIPTLLSGHLSTSCCVSRHAKKLWITQRKLLDTASYKLYYVNYKIAQNPTFPQPP